MARFLFCSVPSIGHVTLGLPIARALVARGHAVRWYTGRKFRARVEATGARYEPLSAADDYDDQDLTAVLPGLARLEGLAAFKFGVKHLFVDPAPAQLADLRRILGDFPADVLVSDTAFVGALFLYETGGPVRAVYGISPLTHGSRDTAPLGLGLQPTTSALGRARNVVLHRLFREILFRDVDAYYNRVRGRVGLPPTHHGILNDAFTSHLYLQGTTALFEYPRSDLPPQVHFIGPLLPDPTSDFVPPAWWDDLLDTTRPVVYVTQGTFATDSEQLLLPTIRALASEDVLVAAATGGKPIESVQLDPVPDNVRLDTFIPYRHLLPHVDVMVTNGGYGGVQFALANGVPLVAAGRTEEKPEVCARIAWAGVGIDLKTHRPTPDRIRAAVRAIRADPRYARNAARIKADFARHDAPAEAALLLERLATTKQPVIASPDGRYIHS